MNIGKGGQIWKVSFVRFIQRGKRDPDPLEKVKYHHRDLTSENLEVIEILKQ